MIYILWGINEVKSSTDSFLLKNKNILCIQGGKQKKQPRRPNALPHSLELCSNLPNDHGHFDEV